MAKSFAYLPSVPSRRANPNPRTVVRPSSMEHVLAASVSAASALRGSMVVSIIAMMPSPMSVFFMVFHPTPWLLFFICSFVDILIFRGFFQQEESAGLSGEVFFWVVGKVMNLCVFLGRWYEDSDGMCPVSVETVAVRSTAQHQGFGAPDESVAYRECSSFTAV